ncbi:MAG: slipin family protein [Lentisphaerota bacterium]
MSIRRIKIGLQEKGLVFKNGKLDSVLSSGEYTLFNPFVNIDVQKLNTSSFWFNHEAKKELIKHDALKEHLEVFSVQEKQIALLKIDGIYRRLLKPDTYAYWKESRKIEIEVLDTQKSQIIHPNIDAIMKLEDAAQFIKEIEVDTGYSGLLYINGEFGGSLKQGTYYFWKHIGQAKVYKINGKEQYIDISGQEIMTSDKVSIRLNAVLGFRVTDAVKAFETAEDTTQVLYRDAQIALREIVATKELDQLLKDRVTLSGELRNIIVKEAENYGVKVNKLGIKDIILPGDMKMLLNKVTEAKKAAEANLISRREETAAARSQVNTAKLYEDNPTLMKMKELETLIKIAEKSNFSLNIGDNKQLLNKIAGLF